MIIRPTRSSSPPPAPPVPVIAAAAPATGVSWPGAFLASVTIVAGLAYHYLLLLRGLDPAHATQILLMTAVPLVALVLPASAVGVAARSLCRSIALVLGRIGSGGPQ